MQHKNNEFETNKRTVDCCVLVPWWWGDTKAMAASMRGAESCRGVCRGRWTSAVQTRESTHRIEGKRAAGGRPRFVREKQEERQPVLRVQGAAGGCRDAFGPPWWEEGTNTPDSSQEGAAMMAGDAMTAAVGSGGESAVWLRRSGLAKVWHHGRSLVRKVMAGDERERGWERIFCVMSASKVINDKISFVYH
jgi:hypothetical protein